MLAGESGPARSHFDQVVARLHDWVKVFVVLVLRAVHTLFEIIDEKSSLGFLPVGWLGKVARVAICHEGLGATGAVQLQLYGASVSLLNLWVL